MRQILTRHHQSISYRKYLRTVQHQMQRSPLYRLYCVRYALHLVLYLLLSFRSKRRVSRNTTNESERVFPISDTSRCSGTHPDTCGCCFPRLPVKDYLVLSSRCGKTRSAAAKPTQKHSLLALESSLNSQQTSHSGSKRG